MGILEANTKQAKKTENKKNKKELHETNLFIRYIIKMTNTRAVNFQRHSRPFLKLTYMNSEKIDQRTGK